jgi:hypothetical protein
MPNHDSLTSGMPASKCPNFAPRSTGSRRVEKALVIQVRFIKTAAERIRIRQAAGNLRTTQGRYGK